MGSRPWNCLSLCTGVGGLELGLGLAVPAARPVCYVEREAFYGSGSLYRRSRQWGWAMASECPRLLTIWPPGAESWSGFPTSPLPTSGRVKPGGPRWRQNPVFTEWLMGFPLRWTALGRWVTP